MTTATRLSDERREVCRPSVVVLDLGGVLIEWDPRRLYRRLLPDEAAVTDFLATVCTPAWNRQMDAGKPWAQGVAELTSRFPRHAALIRAFDERWEEMLGGPIAGTVALLRGLRAAGVPCYALSNWSADKFALAEARHECLGWFDGRVISGHEGVAKPDAALFERLLARYRLRAVDCLFVDDVAANVAAAVALGFVGHRFVGPAALAGELARHGLVPDPHVAV